MENRIEIKRNDGSRIMVDQAFTLMSKPEFIRQAKKVHGNKYDYSKLPDLMHDPDFVPEFKDGKVISFAGQVVYELSNGKIVYADFIASPECKSSEFSALYKFITGLYENTGIVEITPATEYFQKNSL